MIKEAPGRKDDSGKPRFSLLRFGMPRALEGVARVLTFGAQKYEDHSWQRVENAHDRYWSALERHLNAIGKGEEVDSESGLPHIDHVVCNAMFLAELHHRSASKAEPATEASLLARRPACPRPDLPEGVRIRVLVRGAAFAGETLGSVATVPSPVGSWLWGSIPHNPAAEIVAWEAV